MGKTKYIHISDMENDSEFEYSEMVIVFEGSMADLEKWTAPLSRVFDPTHPEMEGRFIVRKIDRDELVKDIGLYLHEEGIANYPDDESALADADNILKKYQKGYYLVLKDINKYLAIPKNLRDPLKFYAKLYNKLHPPEKKKKKK